MDVLTANYSTPYVYTSLCIYLCSCLKVSDFFCKTFCNLLRFSEFSVRLGYTISELLKPLDNLAGGGKRHVHHQFVPQFVSTRVKRKMCIVKISGRPTPHLLSAPTSLQHQRVFPQWGNKLEGVLGFKYPITIVEIIHSTFGSFPPSLFFSVTLLPQLLINRRIYGVAACSKLVVVARWCGYRSAQALRNTTQQDAGA